MVNVENVTRVADAIEAGELVKRGIGFNMAYYADRVNETLTDHIDACDTVTCIAGWAYGVARPKATTRTLLRSERIEEVAYKFLGLNIHEAWTLFVPHPWDKEKMHAITPAQAVRVLRHLAKTGKVDWRKAGKP